MTILRNQAMKLTAKKSLAILFMLCLQPSCNKQEKHSKIENEKIQKDAVSEPLREKTFESLDSLKSLNGKYAFEIQLLNKSYLKNRLSEMLGSEYEYMKSIRDVETPIEIKNNLFYSWGMQQHSGGETAAIFMANLQKNVLYVGIRKEGKETLYSEDNSKVPQQLTDWAKD